ncbi:MAG TPA: prepilin-type N-terminal cleavage/methylation domain-containing protein [Phycisphaerae bacterium]|nr:prepilin-type N-terminal cleavage/methylation domain-containing protein [Phycisphaerae bacterium]
MKIPTRLHALRDGNWPRAYASGGFTLIELLVVVAIIAILIAILLPSLGRAKDRAKETRCASNLKMLGTAATEYANDYNAYIGYSAGSDRKVLLYPYLGQGQNNADVSDRQVWTCPSDIRPLTQCGYGFNTNLNWQKPTRIANAAATVTVCDSGLLDNGNALADSLTTQVNAPSAPTSKTCLRPNARHNGAKQVNIGFFDTHVEPMPITLPFYPPPNANNNTTWQYASPAFSDPASATYTDGLWDLN